MSSPSWAEGTARTRNPARSTTSPAIDPDRAARAGSPSAGACSRMRRGQDQHRRGRGRHQLRQRPRVEVVGVLVAGQYQVHARAGRPRATGRPRHPDVRPVGARVLRGQVLGEIGIDDQHAVRDLITKPLCPSHQIASVPGAGRLADLLLSSAPWRTGSIMSMILRSDCECGIDQGSLLVLAQPLATRPNWPSQLTADD